MPQARSTNVLFDAADRIQLPERSITVTFADNTIRMKFPQPGGLPNSLRFRIITFSRVLP